MFRKKVGGYPLTENLVRAELLEDRLKLLGVADKIDVQTLHVGKGRENVEVVDNVTEVGGNNDGRNSAALGGKGLVDGLESILNLRAEIEDEDRLVDLDALGTGSLESLQELNVDRHKLVNQSDGVDGRATVGFAESEERDGADEHGTGLEASLLGLEELPDGLGVLGKGEGLVVLKGGLDIVVVGVEPLDHLKGGDVHTALLVATAHSEVLIERGELLGSVALGNSLEGVNGSVTSQVLRCEFTYIEELDVVEDVVVEGEVVRRDDVDTGILLDLPVGETEPLALSEEILLRDLVGPVSLIRLLEVPKDANATE